MAVMLTCLNEGQGKGCYHGENREGSGVDKIVHKSINSFVHNP